MDKNEDESPEFSFEERQMNVTPDTKDKDASVGMRMAWQLSDVRKISYEKEKNGHYTLLLDVSADKVKMAMSLGGFSGPFNTDRR